MGQRFAVMDVFHVAVVEQAHDQRIRRDFGMAGGLQRIEDRRDPAAREERHAFREGAQSGVRQGRDIGRPARVRQHQIGRFENALDRRLAVIEEGAGHALNENVGGGTICHIDSGVRAASI